MLRQIALQLVRQEASDEAAVADQIQSLPDRPAAFEVQLVDTDETQVEDVDKLDQNMVSSKNQTAAESLKGNDHDHSSETSAEEAIMQMDLPDEPAVVEVQVADTDEPVDSKVCNKV